MSPAEELTTLGATASDGHAYVDWDEAKAERLMLRLEEVGAVHVYVSPDVAHMLVPHPVKSAAMRGFVLTCDESLPPNSVVDRLTRVWLRERDG